MANYYLYRVNTGYDGFLPSLIPDRTSRGIFTYNWGAYVESLEPGDVVLTNFAGAGCRDGIYAVTVIRNIDITKRDGNVRSRLLAYSDEDCRPLIPMNANRSLFSQVRLARPRGAEVIVPDDCEEDVYGLLAENDQLFASVRMRNVILPGAVPYLTRQVGDVPLIDPNGDLSQQLVKAGVLAGYWIRPRQASWIANAPDHLSYITSVFGKFKSGDVSRLLPLAEALYEQILSAVPDANGRFGVILPVPLSEKKRKAGEIDRVAGLAKAVSARMGVPFSDALRLDGGISRRLYKNQGKSANQFRRDYLKALVVRQTDYLRACTCAGKEILLLDDVYTDGVTTRTVTEGLTKAFPDHMLRVRIATLGMMAKQKNMDRDLIGSWR